MVRFAQLVIGPAGSGKSTYCDELQKISADSRRTIHVVNLDPAAEHFEYRQSVDIRELISVQDVCEELGLGPNGGLVYCIEYLLRNFDWLEEQLEPYVDGDYLCLDCPGQIELYTHFDVMQKLIRRLETLDIRLCALYFLDSQFMVDTAKFFGGCMTALSAMVQLSVTHINVLSKMDLVKGVQRKRLDAFVRPDYDLLAGELNRTVAPRFYQLNEAISHMLEDYNMISFVPLDYREPDALQALLLQVDLALNYDESVEPRAPEDDFDPDGAGDAME